MSPVKVLFIGGTGTISSACVRRALDVGMDVFVLNRGSGTLRSVPKEAHLLRADIHDPEAVKKALRDREFDVVANFVAFEPEDVRADIELFAGRAKQYVFISSASAYQTPPARIPVLESTPLRNPFSRYSQKKIECEDVLVQAYRESGFPATIVRPSHTYDRTTIPTVGGWTVVDRMRRGKEVVVHGDGTSLWTLTHHVDFAKAFVGLLGNPRAIGENYHITSEEFLTWNQIIGHLADAAGVSDPKIVHVSSAAIAAADEGWGGALLGDMKHSMVFDNTKIRTAVPEFVATIPFATGAREMIDWYDADSSRRRLDEKFIAATEFLLETYRPRPR
ncbi:NAD-dependent epimerase/dehydratase family protein [Amycolatopsis sp.]|uniref:NAD-dependent epimerase/dehydratase family protein n=1 Tax=Amycolatopsis sp. TaxID=37632 RepID=UPI002DF99145|nr:NAD-dependent epimerase/dehydratase family protein [Amycolatopsis sp.]